MAKNTKQLEAGIHDQTNLVPLAKRLKIFFTLAACMFVCYVDQNGITVLLPTIAKDLDAASTIAWAGTSALIANTVFQVLYGRLSDLFGRKRILIACLFLLGMSDLVCGLAHKKEVLYVFRGVSGIANGGIVGLVNMIMSDTVTLRQRGMYQGISGSFIGLGNAAGPLIAAAFVKQGSWRNLFYLDTGLPLLAGLVACFTLDQNMPKVKFREAIRLVDWTGLFFSTVAIVLLLIAISDGGHGTPWNSAEAISMLVIGTISAVIFIIVEWKLAKLPMMPLSFWKNRSIAIMLIQSFLLGLNYYALLYYLPLYFQNVLGLDTMGSAVLILPLVLVQSLISALGGQYMTFAGHYVEVLFFGFLIWTIGSGLLITLGPNSPVAHICGFMVLVGIGAGATFQTSNTGIQAHAPKVQRAVAISNRMLLRQLGGATGLAISSAISGNVLKSSLPAHLQYIAKSTFAVPDLKTVGAADRLSIITAYSNASRGVFTFCVVVVGIALLLTFLINDQGLAGKDEVVQEDVQSDSEQEKEVDETPNAVARFRAWRESLVQVEKVET
jgi:MFS family permease